MSSYDSNTSTRKIKVLFLCTGNSARSQMAEAWLCALANDNYDPHSAGLEPKEIHPLTLQVMNEVGIDLSRHRSKGVGEYLGKVHFTYLITVCSKAEEKCPTTFLGVAHRIHWPFDDPAAFEGAAEAKLQKFREVRDAIQQRIQAWLEETHP